MTPSRRQALAVGIASVAALGCAHWWRPKMRLADTLPKFELETAFPKKFGGWAVDEQMPVQLVSPDQKAVLDQIYSQTLSRTYVNADGQRIMLSVAYGGDQSDATRAHRPEVCYPAQGFQINGDSIGHIQLADRSVHVRQLVAVQGGRIEPITYWVMVGNRVAASGTEQKLQQLEYSIKGLIPDGMLVRISNISSETEPSYLLHQRFAQQLARSLHAPELDRIFGALQPKGAG